MLKRYSHSALNSFRSCPRQYRFRYVDRIEIPKRITADAYLGAAVHRQLELVYKWSADGKLYPLDKALAAFMAEWDKPDRQLIEVTAEHVTVDDYIENGRKMIEKFYRHYEPFSQGTLLGAELNVNFTLPDTPIQFNARIDRLLKYDDGVVEICDYKTGQRMPLGVKDPAFYLQMGLYHIAIQTIYPQFETIELAQYFLRQDEVIRHRMRPDEVDEMTEQLRQSVLETAHAERLDDFPTREGRICSFCDYEHLCPAKRHRRILETEAGKDAPEKATMETAETLANRFIELHGKYKELEAELNAMKEDIKQTAADLSLDKLSGKDADVTVRCSLKERFPTKTKDLEKYTALSQLARQWQLDTCFTLDTNMLMKDIYKKQQLGAEQLAQLEEFVAVEESATVSVRQRRKTSIDD
ncbi:MAG: PD-(D/E)XK nuclease family protein [candidate division Zixibacteria bacterium]|nr:PD-(D/E)XK nuclease family protein [candidate division Zixibacteria bacterium]